MLFLISFFCLYVFVFSGGVNREPHILAEGGFLSSVSFCLLSILTFLIFLTLRRGPSVFSFSENHKGDETPCSSVLRRRLFLN